MTRINPSYEPFDSGKVSSTNRNIASAKEEEVPLLNVEQYDSVEISQPEPEPEPKQPTEPGFWLVRFFRFSINWFGPNGAPEPSDPRNSPYYS